jgi:hypothetical protein
MKLSDFLIRGRHLFGFLIPGVMWVSCLSLVVFKKNPLEFVEEGTSPLLRTGLLLATSYIVGFSVQTLLFPLLADPLKHLIGKPKTLERLGEQIQEILAAKLPAGKSEWLVVPEHLPGFCKMYIIEHSKELKHFILEKEDDINFLVANIIPGPLLIFSWLVFKGYSRGIKIAAVVCAVIFGTCLMMRLHHYLRREKEEWYEWFLVLQLRENEDKSKAESKT